MGKSLFNCFMRLLTIYNNLGLNVMPEEFNGHSAINISRPHSWGLLYSFLRLFDET